MGSSSDSSTSTSCPAAIATCSYTCFLLLLTIVSGATSISTSDCGTAAPFDADAAAIRSEMNALKPRAALNDLWKQTVHVDILFYLPHFPQIRITISMAIRWFE